MPNRLANETSPYLLQHAKNPVDWYPWGPEALKLAKEKNWPIFLSIGYSACHWCHVMEHESFEDAEIAKYLNEHFVCIKVDREERPDLDHIYMAAVQALSGRGGWPMSVFLTPDLKPFFGGTYWPPKSRMGMPGFDRVMEAVIDAWTNRREAAVEQAQQLTRHIAAATQEEPGKLTMGLLHGAEAQLERGFDPRFGGFGGAPKFPHAMDLRLLLRLWQRKPQPETLKIVTHTLDRMAAGGIYDHLGGGFHRYSVDERWLVPHFEKMLYDNALLTGCYVEAYQATKNPEYARVVRETCDFVLRDMTDAAGGFFSTLDADSEGEEGKFYVWSPAEISRVLDRKAAETFCQVYDVTPEGNFEGANILNLPKSIDQQARLLGREPAQLQTELAAGRAKLLAVRSQRVWPGLDDKVLVSWNALMIDSLALAAGVLEEPRYLEAAQHAARFILEKMTRPDGRLLHTYRQGEARLDAYLDDYAYLANALITLYEADFDPTWIDQAARLLEIVQQHFVDADAGGYFFTADDHEELITRYKDSQDASVPSGNGMAATVLSRMAKLCGRSDWDEAAQRTLEAYVWIMDRHPTAAGQMLLAVDFRLGPTVELVLTGPSDDAATSQAWRELRQRFLPRRVLASPRDQAAASPLLAGILEGKRVVANRPTLYVCQNFACQAPVSGSEAVAEALQKLSQGQ